MKHFKYIIIPKIELIQEQIIQIMPKDFLETASVTFLKQFPDLFTKISQIPEFKYFLEKQGWFPHLVSMVFHNMEANSTFDIHTDPIPETVNIVRILFPVKNCANTYTHFYETNVEPEIQWIHPLNGPAQPYKKYKESDCTLVARANLSNPYLINTQSVHGINNPTNNRRMSLWINFDNKIDLYQYL